MNGNSALLESLKAANRQKVHHVPKNTQLTETIKQVIQQSNIPVLKGWLERDPTLTLLRLSTHLSLAHDVKWLITKRYKLKESQKISSLLKKLDAENTNTTVNMTTPLGTYVAVSLQEYRQYIEKLLLPEGSTKIKKTKNVSTNKLNRSYGTIKALKQVIQADYDRVLRQILDVASSSQPSSSSAPPQQNNKEQIMSPANSKHTTTTKSARRTTNMMTRLRQVRQGKVMKRISKIAQNSVSKASSMALKLTGQVSRASVAVIDGLTLKRVLWMSIIVACIGTYYHGGAMIQHSIEQFGKFVSQTWATSVQEMPAAYISKLARGLYHLGLKGAPDDMQYKLLKQYLVHIKQMYDIGPTSALNPAMVCQKFEYLAGIFSILMKNRNLLDRFRGTHPDMYAILHDDYSQLLAANTQCDWN